MRDPQSSPWLFQYSNGLMTWMIWGYPYDSTETSMCWAQVTAFFLNEVEQRGYTQVPAGTIVEAELPRRLWQHHISGSWCCAQTDGHRNWRSANPPAEEKKRRKNPPVSRQELNYLNWQPGMKHKDWSFLAHLIA